EIEAYGQLQAFGNNGARCVLGADTIEEAVQVDGAAVQERQLVAEIAPDVIVAQQQVAVRTIALVDKSDALLGQSFACVEQHVEVAGIASAGGKFGEVHAAGVVGLR